MAAALCLAIMLGACAPLPGGGARSRTRAPTTTTGPRPPTSVVTTSTLPPPAPVDWMPCQGGLQCGSVTVPVNYADPTGATIDLALIRHPAEVSSQRIGSLVIDPGGPGVSGVDDMSNELASLTPGLLDDFDIVMFDPRGVQRSDPVTCGESSTSTSPNTPNTPNPDPVPQTPAAVSALVAAFRAYAASCEKASGSILPYVGTVDAARDLDRIRTALGDPGLTYMGQSYGTLLGASYAQLFPSHVRAMVLDSAIDPTLSSQQMIEDQAVGFEQSLGDFFTWCAGLASCPWRPDGDPTAAVLALINQARTRPIPAGGNNTVGPGEIYDALLAGLYSRSDWPTLADALSSAAAGDGQQILSMSTTYGQNGASNGGDAATAISCLDHPVSRNLAAYTSLASAAGKLAPVFGPLLAWGQAGCAVWPALPTRTPGPLHAAGSPPILVVGTTGDPATPYAWAEALAGQLAHGVLLTRDGVDHVAYFYSACVRDAVQAYFVSGTLPAAGATCTS